MKSLYPQVLPSRGQITMEFETALFRDLSPCEHTSVVARLANLLMEAAGPAKRESGDEER